MRFQLIVLLALVLLPTADAAKQGRIKLLAAKEGLNGTFVGSTADLFLEIQEGSGRVFLDTFPLTKVDTQISTRFAKEVACNYLDYACDGYDFIYTIRADSSIIGGPSAGAAAAALTVALLDGITINQDIAITGTINSGGVIGPVGGILAKIDAAKEGGAAVVLVPKGEGGQKSGNSSIDAREYGENLNITVIEVSSLDEVLSYYTGASIPEIDNVSADQGYQEAMRQISERFCNRSSQLGKNLDEKDQSVSRGRNLTLRGEEAMKLGDFYSAASYCFGANVQFTAASLLGQNLSAGELLDLVKQGEKSVRDFGSRISKEEKKTLTDLQSSMIIRERLDESRDVFTKARLQLLNGTQPYQDIAYGFERIYTASAWSVFFNHQGRAYDLDPDKIKDACINKLLEVEERMQYISLVFPVQQENDDLKYANADYEKEDYEMCLFRASKAKASADIIMAVLGLEDGPAVDDVIEQKLRAAKKSLARQAKKGIFPILAYSYYEYANSLKTQDRYSSLLFAEYSLELSQLDAYFKEKKAYAGFSLDTEKVEIFLLGLAVGIGSLSLGRIIAERKRKHVERRFL